MPSQEAEAIYYAMLDSGDLLDLYPNLSGEWAKDEKQFIRDYNLNNSLIDGDEDIYDSPFEDNEFDY